MTVTVSDPGPAGHTTYLVSLHPTRADWPQDPTAEEQEALAAHFRQLEALTRQGRCVIAGPCLDAQLGVAVLDRMTVDEARDLLLQDAMVVAGYFTADLRAMRLSLERSLGQ